MTAKSDFAPFKRWATAHRSLVEKNQKGKRRYNATWARQRLTDIDNVLKHDVMFIAGGSKRTMLRQINLSPKEYYTLFLALDRPAGGRIGETFDLQVVQRDSKSQAIIGGLDLRVELQPEPKGKGGAVASTGRSRARRESARIST